MAISDARKRANQKWDAQNMTVLGCKMRRDAAEVFKMACKDAGTTPNAVFRAAVDEFMRSHQDTAEDAPEDA